MSEQETASSATEFGGPTTSRSDEDADRYPKTLIRLIAWVSRQSLPRLIGLLFGNTRELETALAKAEVEVVRVRSESSEDMARLRIEADKREQFWQSKFSELADSMLLSKGLLPASSEAREIVSGQHGQVAEPKNSPRQMELEVEADKLLEMLQHGDAMALQERIEDLLHSNRPRDKRVLALYAEREQGLSAFERNADIGMGVVIGAPEAQRVS